MTIRAIGFDWGGVLNGMPGKVFSEQVSRLLGVTSEEYQTAYFHHNKKVNRGEITWEELWTQVLEELGHLDKLQSVMQLSEDANGDDLNHDVLELVDKLRAHGYKVGLLSNNSHEKADAMRQAGLDKHFDAFDISAETGLVKPELEAFQHLCDELGVVQDELVFIDDSEKSLSTASECGFRPILFESYSQLCDALRKLEVKID